MHRNGCHLNGSNSKEHQNGHHPHRKTFDEEKETRNVKKEVDPNSVRLLISCDCLKYTVHINITEVFLNSNRYLLTYILLTRHFWR